jgi:catechol 2,3-dioxygenase-like lactoylglutathione lyase family enzyme
MGMNRINVIALGVRNMEKSIRFYRDRLGFQTNEKGDNPKVVFFNTSGTKFELYPLELLTQDISETNPPKIGNDCLWHYLQPYVYTVSYSIFRRFFHICRQYD